jgi:hypothetical protein
VVVTGFEDGVWSGGSGTAFGTRIEKVLILRFGQVSEIFGCRRSLDFMYIYILHILII